MTGGRPDACYERELAQLKEELLQERIDCHIHADEADRAEAELRKWRELDARQIAEAAHKNLGTVLPAAVVCDHVGRMRFIRVLEGAITSALTLDEPEEDDE
jgi:hypothetical protein